MRNLASIATHIYKLKVLEISKSGDIDDRDSSNEATFGLIEVLKEEVDQRSNTQESIERPNFRSLPIPDITNSWMSKGQIVILFYENDQYWNSSRSIVSAGPENVSAVMDSIARNSPSSSAPQLKSRNIRLNAKVRIA